MDNFARRPNYLGFLKEMVAFTLNPKTVESILSSGLTPDMALSEYKTIGFTGTRQSGKSYTVLNLAKEYSDKKFLVIKPNQYFCEIFDRKASGVRNIKAVDIGQLRELIEHPENQELAQVFSGQDFIVIDESTAIFSYHGVKHRMVMKTISQLYPLESLPTIIKIG